MDTFPGEPTLDDLIRLFQDRVLGWQIGPAEALLDHKHSGFGTLLIATAYFEMISRVMRGDRSTGQSRAAFHAGFCEVFPEFDVTEENTLWKELRNGLYHRGMTGPSILLTEDYPEAIVRDQWESSSVLRINPRTFIARIRDHFEKYIACIHRPEEVTLRDNFSTVFLDNAANIDRKRQHFSR